MKKIIGAMCALAMCVSVGSVHAVRPEGSASESAEEAAIKVCGMLEQLMIRMGSLESSVTQKLGEMDARLTGLQDKVSEITRDVDQVKETLSSEYLRQQRLEEKMQHKSLVTKCHSDESKCYVMIIRNVHFKGKHFIAASTKMRSLDKDTADHLINGGYAVPAMTIQFIKDCRASTLDGFAHPRTISKGTIRDVQVNERTQRWITEGYAFVIS